MSPRLSTRAVRASHSPVRKLMALAEDARRHGTTVLNLNIGQPDAPTPPAFFRAMRTFSPRTVAYAPSPGYPAAVDGWQRFFSKTRIELTRDDIVVTSGGSEALLFAFMAVADPGDALMVFEPCYPNFTTLAALTGVRLVPVTLRATNGFRLPSPAVLARSLTTRTRALLVCDPSNPTGTTLSDRERATLGRFAKRHDLFIIADETYRELIFSGRRRSFMDDPAIRDRVVLIDSASKRFNVCGARIGCIASKNRDVITTALKLAQARLSAPSIEQHAVVPLLTGAAAYIRPFLAAYRTRVRVATKGLRAIPGVRFVEPRGTFYIMATLPVDDTEQFCRWLLTHYRYKKTTVLLAPGPGFYLTPGKGTHEVRIACVIAPALIRRAMDILAHAIPAYQAQHSA